MDRDPGAAQLGPYQAPRIDEAHRRFWLIIDAMIAALVVVALVGGWAYVQVRGSLRELRTAGLQSLLEAGTRGMQVWIDEKERDAERWASTPPVQDAGRELARLAERGEPCARVPQGVLRDHIAPYSAIEEIAVFNLVGRDGRIIASLHPQNCGLAVSGAFMKGLAPVFEGRTVFVPPLPERDRLAAGGTGTIQGPVVWIETPVRAEDGSVVAALGFGRPAAQRFAGLLALSRAGTTRDAYAFDENAILLTESRFAPAMIGRKLSVRDPGGDLTALAAAALAHSKSEGVLLEPYRSYRGAEVIGAWRWLPDSRMVVAVEIEAAEAYGPLEILPIAFGVLFGLLLVSMTAAAGASLWAVRERLREAKRLGKYRLGREIGAGGMSNVYLARHVLLKRPAAVKVLKSHLATDEVVTRFKREAQLCSQLSHPNTIEIYDYGSTRDGRWYYAMEFLRGISLEELVRRDGPMSPARVVHALRQACGSLKEAHDRGWVHRDVKPGNVMLCVRGGQHDVVKMLDFGLIKQVRNPDTRDITQYAKVLGTPLYMAPERLRDPSDADARADIYALAAVAYFAIVGRAAFEAATDHDIVYRVLNEPAPALPPTAPPGAPEVLGPLVARCLAKDRNERPASIDEVRAALDEAARELPWTEAEARAWWASREASLGLPGEDCA